MKNRAAAAAAGAPENGTPENGLWRSLDELARRDDLRAVVERDFPRQASAWDPNLDRRRFLALSGASLGLAGLTACTKQPPEDIIPYVLQPEELVPGKPLYFATAMPWAGYAVGVLAESHMGRPTKLEGNPEHPASLGRSDVFAQAAVLDLYDPDRSRAIVTPTGKIRPWNAFVDELSITASTLGALGGQGLRILTGTVTSPTLGGLLEDLGEKMPEARWHRHDPLGLDNLRRGLEGAFGEPLAVRYDLTRADVVLAIDSDFLYAGPAAVRYAADFANRRTVRDPAAAASMSRLYSVETHPTTTSTVADHRLALKPSDVARFTLALAAELGVAGATAPAGFGDGEVGAWIEEVAADLLAHRGRALVVAGDQAEPGVHTLVAALNERLGSVGSTVLYSDPVEVLPPEGGSFDELLADMAAGEVDTLLVLGANPAYTALADEDFAAALSRVRLKVHLGPYYDETAELCDWHVPEAHFLESWGDARAFDGTATVIQPLIEPLYGGRSAIDLLAVLVGRGVESTRDLVRQHWQDEHSGRGDGGNFERFWRRSLHDGVIAESALEPRSAALAGGAVAAAAAAIARQPAGGLELVYRPDPTVLDGRFANNPWLQECPKPITKLTWDNAVLMSPATAIELGLGDLVHGSDQHRQAPMVRLSVGERTLEAAAWAVPGHADGALTLHLGYGRGRLGEIGNARGFDANRLRTREAPWVATEGVALAALGGKYPIASTQEHHSMAGRHLVRMTDLDHYLEDPEHAGAWEHHGPVDISLMPEYVYDTYAWGMAIDLTACTGCNACLLACQAENNIPTVGKEQVMVGREMHWIRIDRYFTGDAHGGGEIVNQPVPCMQCEQAPCEVVCPVAATVHSDEGLNDMVYNRCVGTRYCSNNCPYKVRRFNFLLYQDWDDPSLALQRNPDVTVRSRGVMEKCTYCVQRINSARIEAKRESRTIRDGEITTACQQACPSGAIVFGDINDPGSAVSLAKASPLDFRLLEELGTRPRTSYLGRVRNLNPALERRLRPAGAVDDHEAH